MSTTDNFSSFVYGTKRMTRADARKTLLEPGCTSCSTATQAYQVENLPTNSECRVQSFVTA
jgi:hypothetical protein